MTRHVERIFNHKSRRSAQLALEFKEFTKKINELSYLCKPLKEDVDFMNLMAESEKQYVAGFVAGFGNKLPLNTDCGICTDPLIFNGVYSCTTCHNTLCAVCLYKVHRCPFCRSSGRFAVRNVSLEQVFIARPLPCKNKSYGCTERFDNTTRKHHEKHCEFNPLKCPYISDCCWSGHVKLLEAHLNEHKMSLIQNNRMRVTIKHVWSKLKTGCQNKKAYYFIMCCYQLVFVGKITLFQDDIIIRFLQVRLANHNKNDEHFGVGIEVSGSSRTVRGILPLPAAGTSQKVLLPLKFLLSDDFENDTIVLSVDIKDLNPILS